MYCKRVAHLTAGTPISYGYNKLTLRHKGTITYLLSRVGCTCTEKNAVARKRILYIGKSDTHVPFPSYRHAV